MKVSVIFVLLCVAIPLCSAYYVWPKPTSISQGSNSAAINPSGFRISTSSSSGILLRAIQRYSKITMFPMGTGSSTSGTFSNLFISVTFDSEELQLGVDESYNLVVSSSNATLTAQTVFGALRGLETFSQLIDWDDSTQTYAINCIPTTISDLPRYPWRGFLMDTARHYMDASTIYRTIDALAYSKFNTLHWHAVDAESFPVESKTYPLLSQKGAWAPSAVYSQKFIESVVAYALDRGIRVVPEFDMPGHAYSWGKGYPDLTVTCPSYQSNINNVPLNPTLDSTYEMLGSFIPEMAQLFTDDCFHIGGDEVVYGCWNDNSQVTSWMNQKGYSDRQTLQYFENQVTPIMTSANKTAVVWEDLFDDGIELPSNYIVEVWSDESTLQSLVKSGYRTISAYGYYLNNQEPVPGETTGQWVDTWKLMYQFDPLAGTNLTPTEEDLFLGGEAAMWAEQVDSVNYDSRVWPRACAVSERLWSQADVMDVSDATTRLTEHRCRLARRGIGASPIVPDYCSIPYTPYENLH